MTALLDESVPFRLSRKLAERGCMVAGFPNDWKGLKNGELLQRLREREIACLVTCDKNLRYQQRIAASGIGLVVLPRQRFGDLMPFLDSIVEAVASVRPGNVLTVTPDGKISSD
ncbi:hypothetical protein [Aquibium oceanicum]|uniref:VapC45 PIN like domain-containing protein n=1 Tax=Aquibium oceanicum TaxID=1670800 RepID=A0A1L3SV19_9HYPH|nr:hypothetical protein [Aquibium oceanicum]APH73259.1 hypothetical protein BSQ44_19190 [Aquibium oceanicum]